MYENQKLIDQVIDQIKLDAANNDWTGDRGAAVFCTARET